jgi:hypothetical protein
MLQELTCGIVGEGNPARYNAAHLRRLIRDRLLKTDACKGYDDISVYKPNACNFACEDFSFARRVFKWRLGQWR